MSLNHKQARFVAEYLIDFNATQASIRAGYSAKTARAAGSRLLTHPVVGPEVNRRRNELAESLARGAEVTAESHIANLTKIRDAALAAGQFSPAVQAETKIGEVMRLYVRQHADVGKLSSAERAERVKKVLKLA